MKETPPALQLVDSELGHLGQMLRGSTRYFNPAWVSEVHPKGAETPESGS